MPNPSLSEQMAAHAEGKERFELLQQVGREAIEAERQDVIAFINKRAEFLNSRGETPGDTFRVDECFRLLRDIRDGKHEKCAI